jgi:hypothetical protein
MVNQGLFHHQNRVSASGAMKRGVPQTVEETLGLRLSLWLPLSSLPAVNHGEPSKSSEMEILMVVYYMYIWYIWWYNGDIIWWRRGCIIR